MGFSRACVGADCDMKQRLDELDRLHESAERAIKARSTALVEAQRLVGKFEYQLRAAQRSLNDVRAHDLMKDHRAAADSESVSCTADYRRHIEVSLACIHAH